VASTRARATLASSTRVPLHAVGETRLLELLLDLQQMKQKAKHPDTQIPKPRIAEYFLGIWVLGCFGISYGLPASFVNAFTDFKPASFATSITFTITTKFKKLDKKYRLTIKDRSIQFF
jgi:hypothetical protein